MGRRARAAEGGRQSRVGNKLFEACCCLDLTSWLNWKSCNAPDAAGVLHGERDLVGKAAQLISIRGWEQGGGWCCLALQLAQGVLSDKAPKGNEMQSLCLNSWLVRVWGMSLLPRPSLSWVFLPGALQGAQGMWNLREDKENSPGLHLGPGRGASRSLSFD